MKSFFRKLLLWSTSAALLVAPAGVYAAQPKFQNVAVYSEADLVSKLETADVQQDGVADILLLHAFTNKISIMNGTGDGTFVKGMEYSFPAMPRAAASADFNRDGNADIAVALQNAALHILHGDGTGAFTAGEVYTLESSGPGGTDIYDVTAADLNGDGLLDLVSATIATNNVFVLLGNVSGTFDVQAPVAAGSSNRGIAAEDFNGDGNLDLALADNASASMTILYGDGSGRGFQKQALAVNISPLNPETADFNKDGIPDLAVASNGNHGVDILLGKPDGTFAPVVSYPGGHYSLDIAVGDFDGDGNMDLASQSQSEYEFYLLSGKGDGTFDATVRSIEASGNSLGAADFNRDGKTDLAFSMQNSINVLLSKAEGVLELASPVETVDEAAGTVALTVYRTGGTYGQTAVRMQTYDGSAAAGLNYGTVDRKVVFQEGETSQTIHIPITDNARYEGDKTFIVRISGPANGASLGAVVESEVSILENDPIPDTDSPAWPGGAELTVSEATHEALQLSWPEAQDNRGINEYRIFKDGSLAATVAGDVYLYRLDGLASDTNYELAVVAVDAANGTSAELKAEGRTKPLPHPETTPTPLPEGTPTPSPEGTPTPQQGGTAYQPPLSGENRLKRLQLIHGDSAVELLPAFNTETLHYEAALEGDEVVLKLEPQSKEAFITINGQKIELEPKLTLVPGLNMVRIQVTAENGVARTYELNLMRKTEAKVNEASSLKDIRKHWAETDLLAAEKLGIIQGNKLGLFQPEKPVTRAEWAVMLDRFSGLHDRAVTSGGNVTSAAKAFKDESSIPAWAADAVGRSREAGLLGGYEDGTFRPASAMTRAELAAAVARFMQWPAGSGESLVYSDAASIPSWAKPYIAALSEHGLMVGWNGRFEPVSTASRAEAAVVLLRLHEMLEEAALEANREES